MNDLITDALPLCALQPLAVPLRTESLDPALVPAGSVRPGLRELIGHRRLLVEEVARVEYIAPSTWPERTDLKARRGERPLKPILTERRLFGRQPVPFQAQPALDRLDA